MVNPPFSYQNPWVSPPRHPLPVQGCSLRAKLPAFGACGRRQQKQRYLAEHLPEVYAEVMSLGHERGGFLFVYFLMVVSR